MSILTSMFNATKNPTGLNETSLAANLLRFSPNGTAPLFAITGAIGSKTATNVEHGYFAKTMEFTRLTASAAATDSDTSITVAATAGLGLVAGQVLHNPGTGENMRVVSVQPTAVTVTRGFGRIAAQAIAINQALFVVGTAYEEGSARPTPRSIQAVYVSNFTQIWRNSWALTDTARASLAKAGWNNIAESQKDCGYFHAGEIEAALFFGQKHMSVENGQPLHATQGIIDCVREMAPANVEDFAGTAIDYDDMVDVLANAFKVSADHSNPTVRIAYCDNTAMRALQQMGRNYAETQLSMTQDNFGQSFQTLQFYKGTIHFKEHPLFQELGIDTGFMVVVDVPAINLAYLGDRKQKNEGFNLGGSYGGTQGGTSLDGVDADGGSITSEAAVEILNPYGCAVVNGFSAVKPKTYHTKELP